ncbi:uncharacterized protein L203_104117 [Cryptococcus depauperatus CBS 7841]|uniref:Uncharacterized protein n=1 Tax=Cryptococcus depauperatus CBS 7841 TaxID=1295531 RepID=A0AAJ8JV35_9TREE
MSINNPLEYAIRVASITKKLATSHYAQAIQAQEKALSQSQSDHARSNSTASHKTHQSHLSTSSRFAFDLSSLIERDKSKTPRFPEKLIRALDGVFQRIAMGQEPKYSDQKFRRSIAAFWSSSWPDKTFQRQLKESRRVEDLILSFVTTSTKSLKKDEELAAGGWQEELAKQVGLMIDVILDALVILGDRGGTELRSRLEGYRSRIKSEDPPPIREKSVITLSRAPEEKVLSTEFTELETAVKSATEVLDAVGRLLNLSLEELKRKAEALEGTCTEQAAVDDFKLCLKRLNTDSPYPYGPSDFSSPAYWQSWKSVEVSSLSQLILQILQANPSLVESDHDRQSMTNLSAHLNDLNIDSGNDCFTFIPSDPRETYKSLLERCLDYDLDVLASLPEDQEIPLTILSAPHFTLLHECSKRWRLPAYFRNVAFLEAIVNRYEKGHVPAACIKEAEHLLEKTKTEWAFEAWALSEQQALERVQKQRDISLLRSLLQPLLTESSAYLSEDFQSSYAEWTSFNTHLSQLSLVDLQPDFVQIIQEIQDAIQKAAFKLYISESSDKLELDAGSGNKKGWGYIMHMGGWVEKGAKKLDRRFSEGIIADIDIIHIVLRCQLSLWFRDLEDVLAEAKAEELAPNLDDWFSLYRKAVTLKNIGHAYSPPNARKVKYPITKSFEPIVQIWLDQTDLKTREWSDKALAVDNFEPSTEHGPSSSVTDLFDSLRSAAEFLMELEWQDEKNLARFVTRFSKTMSISVEIYCSNLEKLFNEDMSSTNDVISTPSAAITSSSLTAGVAIAKEKVWMEKARATLASLQGEKKLKVFFNFTSNCCVKLNNIEAGRQRLDELYQLLQIDNLAAYEVTPTVPQRTYLFTVKIVLAEGLQRDSHSTSSLPDAFVVLSDEHGHRYAKTRTIYDDADPRWDESVDIPITAATWFMITVRHRNLTGKHDLLGRSYLHLDPAQFQDLITKDVMLRLDTRGHVLLRLSVEGEKDDMQFHFGRAFRCLKRTEGDMIRTFIDKMSPVLRHTLSRANIKSVLKGNTTSPLAYNEALGKLSAAYRTAMGSPQYIIPPTSAEKYRGPTDAEIEAAIHPLFDYLDTNIHTLSSTLSKAAMQMVMAKLWKQILMTIEGLIVPPLSDKPSGMRPLQVDELDVGLKWLKFLRDFFYVGGDESGVPLETLQNQKFNEILSLRIYYDWPTDSLMEECIKSFQSTLRTRSIRPVKSIRAQRNLGTIRARKTAKRAVGKSSGASAEMIMRILRMRPDTQEFLAQQLQTIAMVKLEDPKAVRSLTYRR